MKKYLDIVNKILKNGEKKDNRTGIKTIALPGMMFEHDMVEGFPLITTKNVPFRLIASELEFFLQGITDKKWLQDRNNHIWDEWCSPDKVEYAHSPETMKKMADERDLGPIYGWQWRNFGASYRGLEQPYEGKGKDQLKELVHTLKTDPSSRRMIVLAWNPVDLDHMALPPCHYCFQVTVINQKLNLLWNQRSVDVALGLPFNIASYALLLHLLARTAGLQEGRLVGFLGDTHIYTNHIEGLQEQLTRKPYPLPSLETKGSEDILQWTTSMSQVKNYQYHPRISFEVAV